MDVPITVKPQKDTYNPVGKPQTVDNGTVPDAEASVDKKNAPSGTTVRWKETPEVTTPGEHTGVAIVHYPDGSEEEVDVPIVVRHSNEKGIPEVQQALPEFNGGANGDPEVHRALPEFNGGVNGDPEIHRALPEFAGGVNGDPEVHRALPEFAGGVNGDPEEQPELQEFTGGVNGEPEVQPALPEFAGGVNGEPEVQPELPIYIGREDRNTNIHSNFQDKTPNRSTKRLANTGQTENNSELAGLGLAIVGLFAAFKRRRNDED